MRPHRPGTWFAHAMVLLGGFSLLRALPRVPRTQTSEDTSGATGRGKPEVPPSASARRAGHETEDMSGRTMTRLLAGLGGVVAGVIVGMALLVGWLREPPRGAPLTAEQVAPLTPPSPHLQAAPLQEIADLRAREDALLGRYAWIDAQHTRARIPIGRGMALVVGKTLDTAP